MKYFPAKALLLGCSLFWMAECSAIAEEQAKYPLTVRCEQKGSFLCHALPKGTHQATREDSQLHIVRVLFPPGYGGSPLILFSPSGKPRATKCLENQTCTVYCKQYFTTVTEDREVAIFAFERDTRVFPSTKEGYAEGRKYYDTIEDKQPSRLRSIRVDLNSRKSRCHLVSLTEISIPDHDDFLYFVSVWKLIRDGESHRDQAYYIVFHHDRPGLRSVPEKVYTLSVSKSICQELCLGNVGYEFLYVSAKDAAFVAE